MNKKNNKNKRQGRSLTVEIVDLIQWAYWKEGFAGTYIAELIGCSAATVYKYTQIPNRWQRRTKWAVRLAAMKGQPTPSFNKINEYKKAS